MDDPWVGLVRCGPRLLGWADGGRLLCDNWLGKRQTSMGVSFCLEELLHT